MYTSSKLSPIVCGIALRSFFVLPAVTAVADAAEPARRQNVHANPDSYLARCKSMPTRPGEYKFECPEYRISISVEQPAFGAAGLVEMGLTGFKQSTAIKAEAATIKLGDAQVERPGLRYRSTDSSGARGVAAVVPTSTPDKVRMVGCEERNQQQCEAVLWAVSEKLRTGAPLPESSSVGKELAEAAKKVSGPLFAGRALTVPNGCSLSTEGPKSLLRCANGNLSWVAMAADDPAGDEWIVAPLKKALATQGALTETLRPCVIDGVKANCRDLEVKRADGRMLNSIVAEATVRKQRLFMQCNFAGARSDQIHPPCAEVMKIDTMK